MEQSEEIKKNCAEEEIIPQLLKCSQSNGPKVVAAIPCFNTASVIADVVSRARKHVDQVIVINRMSGSHWCNTSCVHP